MSAKLRRASGLIAVPATLTLGVWAVLPPDGPLRAALLLVMNTLVVAALVVAVRHHRPAVRLPWLVLVATQTCSAAAFAYWYLLPSITGNVLPVPSPADGLFLLVYAGNCVAVGLLIVRRRDDSDRRALLDVLMVTASLGTLSWVFLMQPYVQDAQLSTWAKLVSVAYPGLDLVLVVLTLRLAFNGGRSTPAKALLLCWASVQLVGNTAYGVMVLMGNWTLASPIFLLWMAAFAFLAAAALHPTMAELGAPIPVPAPEPGSRWARRAVVATPVLALPAVLTFQLLQGDPDHLGVIAAASVAVCLLALARGHTTGASHTIKADRVALLRLVAGFVICALLPLALLAISSIRLGEGAVKEDARGRISATSSSTAALVQNEMEGLSQLVAAYAQRQLLRAALGDGSPNSIDTSALRRHLIQLKGANPRIDGTFITDTRGRLSDVVPVTPEIVGEDFSYRDWYRGALVTDGPYVSEAYETRISGNDLVVAVATAIRRPGDGKVIGVMAAVYDLQTLQSFSDKLADAQGVTLRITDQRGVLVATPGADGGHQLVNAKGEDGIGAALRGGKRLRTAVDGNGEEVLSAYGPVPNIGWTVTARMPTATAYASLGPLRSTMQTIAILLGQVLLGGLVLMARAQRQRHAAERNKSEREEGTRAILEATGDAFVAIDATGVVTSWSPQSELLFGWTSKEACGSSLAELIVPPDHRQAHIEGINRVVRTGASSILNQRVDLSALHRDGQEFPVELVIWRSSSDGNTSFNAFIHDISERKQHEAQLASARDQALEASQVKTEFMAVMSHELRTPMNGVLGMTSLLLSTELTAEQRDYAETVRSSADNLLDLLNEVLDLSKLEADRLELEILDFDPHAVASDVILLLEGSARAKGVSLAAEIADDVPLALSGDPARLRQIMFNLVGNALKFTSDGSVRLRVMNDESPVSDGADPAGVRLRFEVTDTGIGIAEDARERLFEAFSQADASTTRQYGGTGLGLAISKNLVELFGGDIGVRSDVGVGSTFWFTAQFMTGSPTLISTKPTPVDAVRTQTTEPGLVLVVDDNATNQRIAVRMLENLGHRADVAASGIEAVDACARMPYDLVLMDCRMPLMDGYEATRTIRAAEGTGRRTPIVAMTASAMFADRERCLAVGMDDYLSKPVRLTDLADMVDRRLYREGMSQAEDGTDPIEPVLDGAVIAELVSLGDEVMAGLVPAFVLDTQERLAGIRAAVHNSDADGLSCAALALRGSAGDMGGMRVATLCRRLEDAGRAGRLDPAPADLIALEAEVEQMLAAVSTHTQSTV